MYNVCNYMYISDRTCMDNLVWKRHPGLLYLELALDVCHVATGSGVFSTELSDQKLLLLLC